MWKQSPHIQCVAAVKSKASSNSGENERETAEFGASDPPKTQLGRNLFSTKYFRHNFSLSEPRTSTGNRNWLFWIKPKNEKDCSFVSCNIHTITHDYPNIPKWDYIISSEVPNEEMVS